MISERLGHQLLSLVIPLRALSIVALNIGNMTQLFAEPLPGSVYIVLTGVGRYAKMSPRQVYGCPIKCNRITQSLLESLLTNMEEEACTDIGYWGQFCCTC